MGLDFAKTVDIFAKAIGILWQVQLQVNILTYKNITQKKSEYMNMGLGIFIRLRLQ